MSTVNRICKADLHVHSLHSNRPSMWALRRFNCPESYTEPTSVYESARNRGMDFVTVSDHNSIDGSLAIADLPGTFISSELTAYMPEDGCKLHVVTLDIPPELFPEMLEARHNVYELVGYLNARDIPHFLAHPLFDINKKLSADKIEKLLLLFTAIEVRNGARAARYNRLTEAVVRTLTPERIERLADKHGIEPVGHEPWRKAVVAGSDDHSGLFVASAHTEAECDGTVQGFLQALTERRTEPGGEDGDSLTLAHSIYAISARFFTDGWTEKLTGKPATRQKRSAAPFLLTAAQKYFNSNGNKLSLVDKARLVALRLMPESMRRDPRTFEEVLEREAWRMIKDKEFLESLRPASLNRRIFAVTSRVVDHLIYEYTKRLFDLRIDNGLAGIIEPISTIGLVHFLTTPYYIAFHNQTRTKELMEELVARFPDAHQEREPKIALFTDTLGEVNGVALTLHRLKAVAKARGVELVLITCTDGPTGFHDGVMNFRSVGDVKIPEYQELSLRFPPILDVLDYIDREDFTHIHVSTPGTVGLMGVGAAKLMDLPLAGSYHTDLPQYVGQLTGDETLEDVAWSIMVAYHSQLDELLVPSQATMDQLAAHGLPREMMRPMPRWVDTERFTPGLRDPAVWPDMGVLGGTRLLYAGRVSREKNLPMLVEVFKDLVDRGRDVSLVVAGDGPYRREMEEALFGYPAQFLGFLPQDELARIYASADLFVFPSATDTFGNVVLEAQSCGLPVLVSDKGGPQELVKDGTTGLVLPAHEKSAWVETVDTLVDDTERRGRMGTAGREFILSRAMKMEEHFSTLLCPGNGRSGRRSSDTTSLADRLRSLAGATTVQEQSDAESGSVATAADEQAPSPV